MNRLEQKWINEGGIFFPISGDATLYETPGKGVFQVYNSPNPMDGRLGLKKISNRFDFNFKIYDLGSDDIISTVKKTWNSEQFVNGGKNLGVIFNGTKGTGKTLSAKLLCNELDMPVVIVQKDLEGLLPFMQSLCFECVVFIDEAEKTFKKNENDDILLRLIDGVYNKSRKLYLLTTNQLTLNDNLLGRPGRIRYTYEFGNLTPKAINEYISDNLLPQYEAQRDRIIQQVDLLEISTIDILKAIVDEVNIYGTLAKDNHMNLPVEKFIIKVLVFDDVHDRAKISEIKAFIYNHMKKCKSDSLIKWLSEKRYDGKGERRDTNEDILCDEYDYVYSTTLHLTDSHIEEGQTVDGYRITMSPDDDGYFMRISKYSQKEQLCIILERADAPSLYHGNLK